MLDNYIDNLKEEMVKETCHLINFPSVSEETLDPAMPFGKAAKDALDYTLNLGKKLGFRTKNLDNYCGYIEFGEGEKLVGIVGHLDVVPSGDGWLTPPFQATVQNGNIYGRGAIDDKGPVIASLYAMKAVKDNLNLNARVRLILGINEEKDWKCIEHYKKTEEFPTIGFSPDADFPCIYAEKGIATVSIKEKYSKNHHLPISIQEIDCNHNAINVVPKYCKVILAVDTSRFSIEDILLFIQQEIQQLNFDITCSIKQSHIELIANGVQAHAAHPDLGRNAISRMLILLNRIFKTFSQGLPILDFFENYIGTEFDGKSLGIHFTDESGNLTLNVGNFSFDGTFLQIGLNLRIPVNTPIEKVTHLISETCKHYALETVVSGIQQPLYVPKNDPLVQTLCNIFNKKIDANHEPIAIGGGTYARAFKNCVSFGANFPGDTDMCHQANEFINIDKLVLTCKIYAEAIYALSQ